jgi:anthranilate synthase component 1
VKQTTFEEFVDLARRGTFVPVVREIMADLLTPVSAFIKIAEHSDYAFLFESVEGGEQVARYSFLGKDPFLVLRARGGRTIIDRSGVPTETDEPFIEVMRRLLTEFRTPFVPGLPRFTGGAVGFVGYDASVIFEPALAEAWENAGWTTSPDAEDDAGFMLFDTVLAFDHVKHRILIIANARIAADEDLEALYQFACAKIDFLERELERGLSHPERAAAAPPEVVSNTTRERFEAGVRTIKEHIAAGDIYQAVLSQRFEAEVKADPFTVYRALRHVNPSPYMYFIRLGELAIVGSSPEMLVRVEGRHVETHPIAGTRPRGTNDDEDLRMAEELKRSEKERAEHVMLVDLGRNDLGRVCEFGSVRVPQYMALERYSHVMHLVSRVEGTLAADRDHLDALVACFPAGTVSGAPKIRAMQILAALEPTRREIYAGAVGYIDFAGNLDFCIAIRTPGPRARPGRRRHRGRLEPGGGVRRDARQGQGAPAGAHDGRSGALTTCSAIAASRAGEAGESRPPDDRCSCSSTTTTRSRSTSPSTSASWACRPW